MSHSAFGNILFTINEMKRNEMKCYFNVRLVTGCIFL